MTDHVGEGSITRQLTFAISADYARHTGGWVYDQRLIDELGGLGWQVDRLTLPVGFPRPDRAQRLEAGRQLASVKDDTILLTDQLVIGVLPELARREGWRLRLVAIVHHPLAMEDLRDSDEVAYFKIAEQKALAHARLVIVPSQATARSLVSDYAVPSERIVVALPGTDPLPLTHSPGSRAVPQLLTVGSVVPRKDHGLMIEALAGLQSLPWQLAIVGDLERGPAHVAALRDQVDAHGLADRVTLAGGLSAEALEAYWRMADLYLASSRHEGYGMAIAEATARGIPVISTEAGAVGEWADPAAVRLVRVGDAEAFREAIRDVLASPARRQRMRQAALEVRGRLPDWRSQAVRVDQRLRALTAG